MKTIQIGIIALLIFSPLAFGAVEVWAKSVLEMTAFGLLGLWLIQYARGKEAGRLRIPWPLWAMAAVFMGLVVYQWAGSGSLYPYGTLGALVLGSAYITVFGLVVSVFRTDQAVHQMALALILIGFGIALFSIFQKYGGNGKIFWLWEPRQGGSIFGPFVNRNHFAGYMEMLIPLAIGYTVSVFVGVPSKGETAWRRFVNVITSEQANKIVLLLFITLVMSVSLVLSLSRAGIVSFFVALILIGTTLLIGRATKRWIMLPGALIGALLVSLTWFGLGPLIDRYQSLFHLSEDPSMMGRVQVWEDTTRLVSDHPLTGAGLGSFGAAYPAYKTSEEQLFYEHAHNDYIQLLAETGWIGFGTAMGILGIFIGFMIMGGFRRKNPSARAMLMGIMAGIVALLIHGMNDFNFHIPSNAVLFAVLLGLAWNLSWPEREGTASRPVSGRMRPAFASVGFVLTGLLFFQSAAAFAGDRQFRLGTALEEDGAYEPAGESYQKALRWQSRHPQYHFAMGRIYERQYQAGVDGSIDKARSEMERAVSLAPTLAEPRLHLGWIHTQLLNNQAATDQFNEVLRLEPTNNSYRHYAGLWFAAIDKK